MDEGQTCRASSENRKRRQYREAGEEPGVLEVLIERKLSSTIGESVSVNHLTTDD